MHKQIFIVMLICLRGVDYISAQQWTKKDSVWLQMFYPEKKNWN